MNTRFAPYTIIEIKEGTDSERLILRKNPVVKLRQLDINGTDIDIDEVRVDKEPGIVWLTTEADISSFSTRSNERNLVRVKYDHALLEETTTQTTLTNAETEGDSVVLEVGSTTGFDVDDYIEIAGMDSMRETVRITAVSAGVSLTVDNLATSHEATSLVTLQKVPKIAERMMLVGCSLAAVARVVGSTFDEITGYEIEELRVQKGEPFTQWRETAVQLRREWDLLVLNFRKRPSIA